MGHQPSSIISVECTAEPDEDETIQGRFYIFTTVSYDWKFAQVAHPGMAVRPSDLTLRTAPAAALHTF